MFEPLLPLYAPSFRCILLDFLGNGRSDRVEKFSQDMWYYEALQTVTLIEDLNCGKVSVIGTRGGAWAAINGALERPDLFHAVIADSFDGRTLNDKFCDNLLSERKAAKADLQARQFYEWCQGTDWEKVVDLDTEALLQCAKEKTCLFHKPLTEMRVPVLLIGSKEDEMCRQNLEQEYREMEALIRDARLHFFETGGHPAIMTNAEKAAEIITSFIVDE